jgi:phosphohistidine phosphatase
MRSVTLASVRYPGTVDVFLIRHAEAVDETVARRDPHRHLTAHGREQAAQLGDRLRWHDCSPSHVWTSPLVRAVQTAEIVTRGIGEPLVIEVVPALAPSEPLRTVIAALEVLARDARVLVFGHEPALSALASLLVDGDVPELARAEAIWISDGRLRWRFAWDADAPAIAT